MAGMREAVLKFPDPDDIREVVALPEAGFVRQRDILPWEKLQAARVTVIGAGAGEGLRDQDHQRMAAGVADPAPRRRCRL
jgi:hypothetical protein